MSLNKLEKRIIELSYRNRLTHVSSCLNTVNLLDEIYQNRKEGDPVILGNGHASLAHFVVLEAHGMCNAEDMVKDHGVHAHRDPARGIWASGGSLGQLEPIAVGMALADRKRTVWLVTSDGACSEGSVWEAFNLASELKLTNLRVYIVANGFGAYRSIDIRRLCGHVLNILSPVPCVFVTPVMPFRWLDGLNGHYLTLTKENYEEAING